MYRHDSGFFSDNHNDQSPQGADCQARQEVLDAAKILGAIISG